jgi:hypothetical protein
MKGVDANDIARNDGIPSLRDLIDEAARWDHRQSFNGDSELADDGGWRRNGETAPSSPDDHGMEGKKPS